MKIFATDIKDKKDFDRIGYHYTQVLADDENHVYLYKMEKGKHLYHQYELVKGKKHINPDGEVVYTYPKDEDFGTSGWYICGTSEYVERKVKEIWHSLTTRTPDFSLQKGEVV